ncbi:hypothetical protein T07_3948 [Trichinella nelsoni]|uniref:Uncharacterized protein n=1 Tax=Trichinella nelsoni TaxID=6336 RepID=A0A0V0S9S1_9BILA|nr:hypothetical protein T07_3948 [Trichinella nelsoni]
MKKKIDKRDESLEIILLREIIVKMSSADRNGTKTILALIEDRLFLPFSKSILRLMGYCKLAGYPCKQRLFPGRDRSHWFVEFDCTTICERRSVPIYMPICWATPCDSSID